MNIETTTVTNKVNETAKTASSTALAERTPTSQTADSSEKSFKDELNSVKNEKTQEQKELPKNLISENNNNKKNDVNDKQSLLNKNNKDLNEIVPNENKLANVIQNNNKLLKPETNNKKNDNLTDKTKPSLSKDKKDIIENNLQALSEFNTKLLSMNNLSEKNLNAKVEKSFSKDTVKLDYDVKSIMMNDNDAMFFANLVENNDMVAQSTAINDVNTLTEIKNADTQKSMQVSATLINSLSEAMKNNQPVRIDFDKNVSVIIKVDKSGKISADFIPGDKAVEDYLRNNIPLLKQRFDDQNLSYNELTYRRSKQQQNNNRQQHKENKDE